MNTAPLQTLRNPIFSDTEYAVKLDLNFGIFDTRSGRRGV